MDWPRRRGNSHASEPPGGTVLDAVVPAGVFIQSHHRGGNSIDHLRHQRLHLGCWAAAQVHHLASTSLAVRRDVLDQLTPG